MNKLDKKCMVKDCEMASSHKIIQSSNESIELCDKHAVASLAGEKLELKKQ